MKILKKKFCSFIIEMEVQNGDVRFVGSKQGSHIELTPPEGKYTFISFLSFIFLPLSHSILSFGHICPVHLICKSLSWKRLRDQQYFFRQFESMVSIKQLVATEHTNHWQSFVLELTNVSIIEI